MERVLTLSILLLFSSLSFLACSEDEDDNPAPSSGYQVPTTYNFENVDYSGQTQRLAMLLEMKTYMAESRTSGVSLDAGKLLAMYANDAANAGWAGQYDASKQLKSKTFAQEQEKFEALLQELAQASQSTVAGEEGVSGVIQSLDGNKQYLVGEDGLDHAQVIEKGLMGACFYYQATSVYFGPDRMNVDNEIVEPGEGTEMEHHWDEAFGYFGVPIDFPLNTDGVFFWGDYSVKRNAVLNCNQPAMDAFLKGRAAISNNDLEARDEAIQEARETWELISVATALHYLNIGIDQFEDMAIRSHAISEAIGFIYTLQFNQGKNISNAQVSSLLNLIAGSDDFQSMNLYNITVEDLLSARSTLAEQFSLQDKMLEF